MAAQLAERCRAAGLDTEVRHGAEALVELSSLPEVDAVMAVIVGWAGLEPTLAHPIHFEIKSLDTSDTITEKSVFVVPR